MSLFCGSLATAEELSKFPAVEIVRSINDAEDAAEQQNDPLVIVGEGIEWDPSSMPEATRSWMMLDIPEPTWEQLELNKDQDGQPLL